MSTTDSNMTPFSPGYASHDQVVAMLAAVRHPGTKPPKETVKAVYSAGVYKAGLPLDILFLQSCMAGMYIAIAGQLFLTAQGGFLGAAFFPTGLIAVVLSSAELFTGDALVFMTSLLGGKVTWKQMARNWTVSWVGNFVGALVWAVFIGYLSESLEDAGAADFAIAVARKKAFQPWFSIFLKSIGANIMVCVAIWQATCSEEAVGKILALWFPVTGFVFLGLDHCIANQFLIPVGMLLMRKAEPESLGDEISVYRLLFQALLPATLGNLIGGSIFVGTTYWYAFDSMQSLNEIRERIRRSWSSSRNIAQTSNAAPEEIPPHSMDVAVDTGDNDVKVGE